MHVDEGRYIAERIPGARFVEVPGADHSMWTGDATAILDEIEEFLTGVRRGPEPDRVLTTVLFTDVVGSTGLATRLGDHAWRDCSVGTTRRSDASSSAGGVGRWTPPAMASSPPSTVPPGRSDARSRRSTRSGDSGCRSGPASTRVRSRSRTGTFGGIAVHIGSRVSGLAGPGEVLVSRTVADLVAGSGIVLAERGEHELKGVPGTWLVYAVESA